MIFEILLSLATVAGPSKFSGYKVSPGAKPIVFTARVLKTLKHKNDLFILTSDNETPYRFPLNKKGDGGLRQFLKKRIQKKTPIKFEIDPIKVRIISISE